MLVAYTEFTDYVGEAYPENLPALFIITPSHRNDRMHINRYRYMEDVNEMGEQELEDFIEAF